MPKKLLLLLFFGTSLVAQDRISIFGSITGPGSLEYIHVLNKNSTKGTITNEYGRFQLAVKLNDTLIVSGIQFYYNEIVISEQHVKNKTITIDLMQRINELDEVTVKAHNLSGNLQTDATNAETSVSRVNKMALDFSGIDLGAPYIGFVDEVDRKSPPNPFGPKSNVPGFRDGTNGGGGGDVLALVGFVLTPVINAVEKIGETKRKNKKRKKFNELKLDKAPERIAEKYSDYMFNELHIPIDQISSFIQHCEPRDILALFTANRQIELLDVLSQEAEIFLERIKKNKD